MTTIARLELELIYREVFKASHFIRENIDINAGSWMSDLDAIIDEKCRENIVLDLTGNGKGVIVVDYLIQQNDINKYKMFIKVWKKHDPAIAKKFELAIKKKITDKGLPETDSQYPDDSHLGIVIIAFRYFNHIQLLGIFQ